MNLTIAPVGFKNNQNNNQQNFGIKNLRQLPHRSEGSSVLDVNPFVRRKRDAVMDRFNELVETIAKKVGVDTKPIDEKGMLVDFVPKFPNSSKMIVSLKDADGHVAQHNNRPVIVDIKRDTLVANAQEFVEQVGVLLKADV